VILELMVLGVGEHVTVVGFSRSTLHDAIAAGCVKARVASVQVWEKRGIVR